MEGKNVQAGMIFQRLQLNGQVGNLRFPPTNFPAQKPGLLPVMEEETSCPFVWAARNLRSAFSKKDMAFQMYSGVRFPFADSSVFANLLLHLMAPQVFADKQSKSGVIRTTNEFSCGR